MNIVKVLLSLSLVFLTTIHLAAAELSETALINNLKSVFPDVEISQVNKTPIDNLYEVIIGPDVIYITADARFVFKGDLLDMHEKQNLTENVRRQFRAAQLKAVPESDYIEFSAQDSRDIVYVFTDVDCVYCRKLHQDVGTLGAHNISVRYLAYPRNGPGSSTYQQMSNVWCAKDRPQALTDAKNGLLIAAADCHNPVAGHYQLGQELGVRGTPAIFLENGDLLNGYVHPQKLLKVLGR